jgi:putative transposase
LITTAIQVGRLYSVYEDGITVRERKIIRLAGYDYSSPGLYFVSICTQNRECVFGEIVSQYNHEICGMVLNEYGKIVKNRWEWLFRQYRYIELDEYAVMPNHFHGIVNIVGDVNNVGDGRDRPLRGIKPLSQLIGAFKTTSSKLIHQNGLIDFKWQRSYHDRIIRDEYELNRIRNYIKTNPQNWAKDRENLPPDSVSAQDVSAGNISVRGGRDRPQCDHHDHNNTRTGNN